VDTINFEYSQVSFIQDIQRFLSTLLMSFICAASDLDVYLDLRALNFLQGFRTYDNTRAICKVCGLAAVRHCYTEGGGDYYGKL